MLTISIENIFGKIVKLTDDTKLEVTKSREQFRPQYNLTKLKLVFLAGCVGHGWS